MENTETIRMAYKTFELWDKKNREVVVIHTHGSFEALDEVEKAIDGMLNKSKLLNCMETHGSGS